MPDGSLRKPYPMYGPAPSGKKCSAAVRVADQRTVCPCAGALTASTATAIRTDERILCIMQTVVFTVSVLSELSIRILDGVNSRTAAIDGLRAQR